MRRFAAPGIMAATFFLLACDPSDDTVTASVKTRLAENATLKASQVEVATESGVVTLTGTVASQSEKDQAVQIAHGATGVTYVVDQLKVQDATTTGGATAPAATASGSAPAAESGDTAHNVGAAVGGALKTAEEATVDAGKTTGSAVNDAAVATGHAAAKGGKAIGNAAKGFGAGVKEGVTGGGKK
jgi:BON domain